MNTLKIFENPAFGEVRILMDASNEPLFCAADVCKALGYARPRNAVATHVEKDDALKQGITDSLGRTQMATFVTESGLYALIFGSKQECAKKFKHWVTSEVLPSIRKTGSYSSTAAKNQSALSDKIQAANFLADFLNLNGASKLAIAKSIADPLGLPTPDYAMDEKTVHAAKDLLADHKVKMSSAEFNKILVSKGIVERMTRPGKGGKTHSWVVIPEKYSDYGKNARNPHAQNQTQALWYDSKFSELLALAGIQEGKDEESHD
jgi:prophage antirepressor-like protein